MIIFDLRLFDGDGGAAASGDSSGASASDAGKNGKSNPLADVQYGIQTSQTDTTDDEGSSKPSFDDLINGEYKEAYDKKMQTTVTKRLKGVNEKLNSAQQTIDSYKPILDALTSRYGESDIEKLADKFLNDDALYEAEALEKGLDTETVKEMSKLRQKARQYDAMRQAEAEEAERRAQFDEIQKQSEKVKDIYPGFSLEEELNNPGFVRLISNGVDPLAAYEVTHRHEIQPAMMNSIAKQAEQKVARAVASNAKRPTENGVGASIPHTAITDPSKLTKQDRAEIRRRVGNGEKISF